MGRGLAILGFVLASVLGARVARADVPRRTSALSWTRLAGAESCIAPRELAREVERRLGRSVFVSAAQADVTVEGRVEPRAPGFRATIRLLDGEGSPLGTRELESADASCAELGAPLSLAMALMIDPDGGAPAPAARSPSPAMLLAPQRDQRASTVPAVDPDYRMRIDAGPIVSAGLFPPGVATGVALRWIFDADGWPAFQLSGAYWPPSGRSSPGIDYSLEYGGLAICPLAADLAVRVEACGGMALGRVSTSTNREDVAAHPFLEARVSRRLVGPMVAGVGVGMVFPLNQEGWELIGGHRPSDAVGTADLGIGIEVP
jgi:hypothetical protein